MPTGASEPSGSCERAPCSAAQRGCPAPPLVRARVLHLVTTELPIRLRDEGRTATWNPALTRSGQVILHVRGSDGELETRRSVNSGRARVRAGETIERVIAAGA
jgi:hypothetical protein